MGIFKGMLQVCVDVDIGVELGVWEVSGDRRRRRRREEEGQ